MGKLRIRLSRKSPLIPYPWEIASSPSLLFLVLSLVRCLFILCFIDPSLFHVFRDKSQTRFCSYMVLHFLLYQEDAFKLIGVPLVQNALAGYNASIVSYGQVIFVDGSFGVPYPFLIDASLALFGLKLLDVIMIDGDGEDLHNVGTSECYGRCSFHQRLPGHCA